MLDVAALVAFTLGTGAAYACPMDVSNSKQTVASVDGKSSKPIVLPKAEKNS
jgi:hypothetical protein